MLGVLMNYKEVQEMEFLLKKELEEIMHDLEDKAIHGIVKRALEERYQIVFRIYQRFATPNECTKYIRHRSKRHFHMDS
jgi:hypothetical protein